MVGGCSRPFANYTSVWYRVTRYLTEVNPVHVEIRNGSFNGVCCVCSDTGLWAFQNTAPGKIISLEKYKGVVKACLFKKDGLHLIKNGDWIAILHPADHERVVWHGVVEFTCYTRNMSRFFRGISIIQAFPGGVFETEWRTYFMEGFPAKFLPAQ